MSKCMESRHLVETENVCITSTSGSLHAVFSRCEEGKGCICTVHVVRSLNLLTPTHAQLYFIKKPLKKKQVQSTTVLLKM